MVIAVDKGSMDCSIKNKSTSWGFEDVSGLKWEMRVLESPKWELFFLEAPNIEGRKFMEIENSETMFGPLKNIIYVKCGLGNAYCESGEALS